MEYNKSLQEADDSLPVFTIARKDVYAKCVKVCDGDTAWFAFYQPYCNQLYKYRCRLQGYDAPELYKGADRERGQASKHALINMIFNKMVTLDVNEFDPFGRPLVAVRVNGINVNKWMVDNGHGEYNDRYEK